MLTNKEKALVELNLLSEQFQNSAYLIDAVDASGLIYDEEKLKELQDIKFHSYKNIEILEKLLEYYFSLYAIEHLDYLRMEKEYVAEKSDKIVYFPHQIRDEDDCYPDY